MFRLASRAVRFPVFVSLVAAAEAFRASHRFAGAMASVNSTPTRLHSSRSVHEQDQLAAQEPGAVFTIADQQARFAAAKARNDERVLNIEAVYNPELLKGKRVLITGANRGLGRAIANECVKAGAETIITMRKPADEDVSSAGFAQIIDGIDVTSEESCNKLATALEQPVDIVINNAGYFWEPVETLENMNFEEELKMIDICAVGPLRIVKPLANNDLLAENAKIAMITSQGGSVSWRFTQNPEGHDFGHHMSKSAANMAGVILAQELLSKGIVVVNLHPGFNKTKMTEKYKDIWEIEGAVDCDVGARRVLHEVNEMTMEKTGSFINCEDGLLIPY